MSHPYENLPERCFWKPAIASRHIADLEHIWDPIRLTRKDKIATAGSCFAQHIGKNLAQRGANFMDCEATPAVFHNISEARRFGYGVFSCRYGNIYTSRQLLQLAQEAFERWEPSDYAWEKDGRYFDAFRPAITPVGEETSEDVVRARQTHIKAVRGMFEDLDLLVFTLGLTEGWEEKKTGILYPAAPGTIAGTYKPENFQLRNLRYGEIIEDLLAFRKILKSVNPTARILLTVSPVPLIATATNDHVLQATTYSKSVLRAVAGDLAADHDDISYFPSYEIISGHPSRGAFFDPDLRNVNQFGVDLVMKSFFSGAMAEEFGNMSKVDKSDFELICDEEKIAETF